MWSWEELHIIGWYDELWHFTVRDRCHRTCPLETREVWHSGSRPLSKIITEIFPMVKWVQLPKICTEEKVKEQELNRKARLSFILLEGRPISNKMFQCLEFSKSVLVHYHHNEMVMSFMKRSQRIQLKGWANSKRYGNVWTWLHMEKVTHSYTFSVPKTIVARGRGAWFHLWRKRLQPGERSSWHIRLEVLGPLVPPSHHWIVGKTETVVLTPQQEHESNTFINVFWAAEVKSPGSVPSPSRPQACLRFIPEGR